MDFELTEEQVMMQDMVRKFADKEIRPRVEEYYREEKLPRDILKKMAELGLMGGTIPAKYGGSEMDYVTYAICIMELARVCQSCATAMTKASGLVGAAILNYGTEKQKQEYLVPLAKGEVMGASGVTEPHSGTDVGAMETSAVKDGDYYIINGEKTWISWIDSSWFLTFATLDRKNTRGNVIAFIVHRDTPGFSTVEIKNKLGFRPVPTGSLFFEDCRIPKSNLVGEEGEGFKVVSCATGNGRLGNAARAVGVAQACLDESIKFVEGRTIFGRPQGKLQLVQAKIADMAVGIETARLLTLRFAYECEQKKGIIRATKLASMAKLYATDNLMKVASDAMTVHGAYGYSEEYPVHRYFREAKGFQIAEGVNDLHRVLIANYVLGYRKES